MPLVRCLGCYKTQVLEEEKDYLLLQMLIDLKVGFAIVYFPTRQ